MGLTAMDQSLPTLPLGHMLQGRYRTLRKLGSGGFGSVYLAVDTRLWGRNVAIKELSDPSPAAQRLFEQEAAVLACLSHPGLVRVSDFFQEGRSHYLVMDYVDGLDLLELAIEAEKTGKLLPIADVCDWMVQVCDAVAYLHRQSPPIIHRDIKPNNIRLNSAGRAILVDFGIAKIDPRAKTEVMAKATSEGYSPPEQYAGVTGTDARSDVYALGATLYALLAVKPPPDSFQLLVAGAPLTPLRRLNAGVSSALEAVVQKAMSLKAQDRYRDGGDLLAALSAVVGSSEDVGRGPSGPGPAAHELDGDGLDVMATGALCPGCGRLARVGARYCPHCGRQLPLSTKCPNCGTRNRPGARFCHRCQSRLS